MLKVMLRMPIEATPNIEKYCRNTCRFKIDRDFKNARVYLLEQRKMKIASRFAIAIRLI